MFKTFVNFRVSVLLLYLANSRICRLLSVQYWIRANNVLARTKLICSTAVEKLISACSQVYVHIHQYMVLSCICCSLCLCKIPTFLAWFDLSISFSFSYSFFCVLSWIGRDLIMPPLSQLVQCTRPVFQKVREQDRLLSCVHNTISHRGHRQSR